MVLWIASHTTISVKEFSSQIEPHTSFYIHVFLSAVNQPLNPLNSNKNNN